VDWCIAVQTKLLTADWPEGILNHSAACERLDEEEDTVIMRGLRVRMGIHAGYPRYQAGFVWSANFHRPRYRSDCSNNSQGAGWSDLTSEQVVKAMKKGVNATKYVNIAAGSHEQGNTPF